MKNLRRRMSPSLGMVNHSASNVSRAGPPDASACRLYRRPFTPIPITIDDTVTLFFGSDTPQFVFVNQLGWSYMVTRRPITSGGCNTAAKTILQAIPPAPESSTSRSAEGGAVWTSKNHNPGKALLLVVGFFVGGENYRCVS